MKILDAYILARTKRKTRRIRMALVTLVSSLLFALLFFGAIGLAGLLQSTRQVENVGYTTMRIT
jgi:cell division protein FtsB